MEPSGGNPDFLKKGDFVFCLDCFNFFQQVHLPCCCYSCLCSPILESASSGLRCRLRTRHSLGIIQAFSTRLRLLRYPASQTGQLLDSQPFWCKRAIARLSGQYGVSQSNKSSSSMHPFYWSCFPRELFCRPLCLAHGIFLF